MRMGRNFVNVNNYWWDYHLKVFCKISIIICQNILENIFELNIKYSRWKNIPKNLDYSSKYMEILFFKKSSIFLLYSLKTRLEVISLEKSFKKNRKSENPWKNIIQWSLKHLEKIMSTFQNFLEKIFCRISMIICQNILKKYV